MSADSHWLKIQNEDFFTKPGEIADREFPGQMNVHSRLDDHPAADERAEATEERSLEG